LAFYDCARKREFTGTRFGRTRKVRLEWRDAPSLGRGASSPRDYCVTSGLARVQRDGGPIEKTRPVDVVLIPADEKHGHGASPTAAMTHVAINEAPTNRMDKVTDEQYES
jgi:hypothetical protein